MFNIPASDCRVFSIYGSQFPGDASPHMELKAKVIDTLVIRVYV